MSLTSDGLKALRLLMREEMYDAFEQRFEPSRNDVNERFREGDGRFEGLYSQNEKRVQEYLFIREQFDRHDEQLAAIGGQLSRHEQYFSDLDKRMVKLEKKSA